MLLSPDVVVTADNIESIILRHLEETGWSNPNLVIAHIRESSDIMCPYMTDAMEQSVEQLIDMVFDHLALWCPVELRLPENLAA